MIEGEDSYTFGLEIARFGVFISESYVFEVRVSKLYLLSLFYE